MGVKWHVTYLTEGSAVAGRLEKSRLDSAEIISIATGLGLARTLVANKQKSSRVSIWPGDKPRPLAAARRGREAPLQYQSSIIKSVDG